MASRGKKKTTFAKLNREARLRERRIEKQARKVARREQAASPVHDLVSATNDDQDQDQDQDQDLQAEDETG